MTVEFWDKRVKKYDDLVRRHGALYDQTILRAKSLLSTSDVVLDLGCASGEYSLDIAPFVHRIHGIDTSANMIALATQKASDRAVGNVTFETADVFARSLDAQGFTAVLALNVLHLVEEIGSVLRRVNELVPSGGLFISQTLCLREARFLFKAFIWVAQKVNVAPPVLRLTALELEAVIADAGFDIADSELWDRKKAVQWIVARKQ